MPKKKENKKTKKKIKVQKDVINPHDLATNPNYKYIDEEYDHKEDPIVKKERRIFKKLILD